MKKVFTLLLALIPTLLALGQKDVPAYGKIDEADLHMTTCDFDPEADAFILLKTGEATYSWAEGPLLETKYRFRVKILRDKGTQRANIRVRYYSAGQMESVINVSGDTYNLDENGNIIKSKLDKANVYSKQLDKTYSETVFTLPDARKGSIIEYTYTKMSKYAAYIDPWYFQDEIPTRYCRFYISVPEYFDFTFQVTKTLPVEVKDETINEAARSFTMRNIPGLREEPYMSAPRDYLQHIDFQIAGVQWPGENYHSYRTDWAKLDEELLQEESFGAQLHKNIPHTEALDKQLAALSDSTARMAAIYDYVRQNMKWNDEERITSEDGVKTAWDRKNGNTADINLILVDLLRDAGLRAYPLLVSTRDHGRVNMAYPLLTQFNEVLAYVQIGDKTYTLNGADKYNPYRLLPYDVQYTQGYVIDKHDNGWVKLVNNENAYKNVVILTCDLGDNGQLSGTAQIGNYDYSKNGRSEHLQEGMTRFRETYFTKGYTNLKIDSLTVSGQDNDSLPLQENVQFTSQLNGSGQYLFFSPNIFLGLESNPFVADKRFTDVDFGYRQYYLVTGSIQIPDGYQFETLPKNMRMIMQDTSIVLQRIMQDGGSMVNFRITLEFKRPVYLRDEYDDFKEFYKKLYSALNEPIVIRKKSQ